MKNKWMTKLCRDEDCISASDAVSPSEHVISLASPSFNYCIGNGGITEGKAVCLFGGESGGKSLLAQLAIIEVQKKYPDSVQMWFDAEYSFNKDWFAKLGGDCSRLVLKQTNDPVKIFDYMENEVLEMLQDGMPLKALCIDSVKAIRYPGDHKKISTAITMGGSGAKYLGPALKGLLPIVRKYSITTFLIQQVYEEMDEYKKMRNPYIVPDGKALKHFCDYMLQVDKIETKKGALEEGKTIIGGDRQVGHKVRVKGKKNRVGAPYRVAEFSLKYDTGIVNVADELFELAKSLGIVYHPINDEGKVNMQFWQFGNHDKIRGEANIKRWVAENKNIQDEMYEVCLRADDSANDVRNDNMDLRDVEVNLEDL